MDMDKSAIDTAWKAAVKDLEAIYTRAKAQQATKKQKWSVKKEKIRRQIHLLEKTIASMQAVAAEEEKKRRTGSPKPPPRPQTVASPSPTSRSSSNETSADSPTNAVNLAAKMQCAQSKLDALRRFYWHPRESNYTLRFSIDGIFYGLRDFFVESFRSSFSLQISHQTNGAQGITPTCKISMKGHTVCCGKHVKVVGEKGTRIPKSIWDSMYMDTDFEASIFLIYVEDLDDPSSVAQGSWEFLFAPEATNVELSNFTRRVKGGMDLPETVVRKLCSDVLSSLIRDLTLLYFPYELALAFKLPPAKLDLQGTIQVTGPSIDDVMEKELEEMDVAAIREAEAKEKLRRQAKEEAAGRRVDGGEAHLLAKPLLDAAAVAVQVFSLLLSDSDKHMRAIAKLLQLSPAQMNLLVALKASGLFPPTHSFRTVASICAYYNAFSSGDPSLESKAAGVHDEQSQKLRATWRRVLELIFIRKMQAAGATGKGQPQKKTFPAEAEASRDVEDSPQFELFNMDAFFDTIGRLAKKPAAIQLSVKNFHCTLNALNVVEALSMLYERVVLGIDYGKPRTGTDGFLYGFRFGRKASLQAAVAAAAAAASTAVKASGQVQSAARSPVLNPRRYRPREMTFRTCEETFGKFWRSLKVIIAFVRDNIDDVSAEVAGNVKGTGDDCVVNGSFKDAEFRGPLNMALAVPPCFLGFYRAETISLGNDRVGLQLDAMLPSVAMAPRTMNQGAKPLESIGRIMLADLTSEILIDLDALIEHEEQRREQLAAARKTHRASGSAEKSHLGEVSANKKPTKHRALAVSFGPKTVDNETDGDENTVNSTALPSRASGQLSVATSAFTKLHTTAKAGSFMMHLLPLVDWLLTRYVRPCVLQSFSQHQVLFDTAQASVLQLLRSPKLELDFDVLARAFIHDDQSLMLTLCGSPLHPTPMVYKDEINLLDIILQVDDLVNIWIDDRYPPYSNPLYF
ncbi:hypothetical protein BBJ28_00003761 [Nothophytophthora sp. Chile5]|nr:hypothetical protein BBJ28_00003761 [Nothophytophthora sp. Chile5]